MSAAVGRELVRYSADADARVVALVNPWTGDVLDPGEPASVAAWLVALRAFQHEVLAPAVTVACELLNDALDDAQEASVELATDDGSVYQVKGETAANAATAVVVKDAGALRDDLDMLVDRGELAEAVPAQTVKAHVEYRADMRRVKALAATPGVIGETVRAHLSDTTRDRKRPTVTRLR